MTNFVRLRVACLPVLILCALWLTPSTAHSQSSPENNRGLPDKPGSTLLGWLSKPAKISAAPAGHKPIGLVGSQLDVQQRCFTVRQMQYLADSLTGLHKDLVFWQDQFRQQQNVSADLRAKSRQQENLLNDRATLLGSTVVELELSQRKAKRRGLLNWILGAVITATATYKITH